MGSFKEFCLEAICSFDAKTLDSESEIEAISHTNGVTIKRLQSIIKALTLIFHAQEEYKKEFDSTMAKTLKEQLNITLNIGKVDYICQKVSVQTRKVEMILNNFGNFGLNIWCPTLSENLLAIVLVELKGRIHEGENCSDLFTNLNKLNNHYCNGEFTILLGKVFEPILLTWVQKLNNKASEQMKRLFKIQADVKEANDISDHKMENFQTLDIKKILKRIHVEWEGTCKQHSLGQQQMIHYGKNGLSEQSLYSKLVQVLSDYAKDLMKLILKDNYFDKSEFVLVINGMHATVEYLNEIFKVDEKEFFKVPNDQSDCVIITKNENDYQKMFQIRLDRALRKFYKGQRSHFQELIKGKRACDEETCSDTILGYLDALFDYIKDNLELESLQNAEENYADHIFKKFKEDLASIVHDEIKNQKILRKPELLEDLRDFRRHFSLHDEEENSRVNETLRAYWLESSNESELISEFMSDFNLDDHKDSVGTLKFTATKISSTGHLEVTLNNLKFDNYKPRRSDEKLSFRITISVLPKTSSEKYSDKHKTKIYKHHDTSEPYIFDLSLSNTNQDDISFKTTFKLEKGGGIDKYGKNQFLQFVIHDHSRTGTNKMFLGMFFIPINNIEMKNQLFEDKFHEIDDSIIKSNDIFKQLQTSSSKFASDINKYVTKKRSITIASITPSKDKNNKTKVHNSNWDARMIDKI